MKKFLFFAMFVLYSVALPVHSQAEKWDQSAPGYPFYSGGLIKDCPQCDTFAIVATTVPPSPDLIDSFKKIATLAGKSHQGVLLTRSQLIANLNELTRLGCKPPRTIEGDNVVYFVDRLSGSCAQIVYDSPAVLRPALEIIYVNRDNPRELRELLTRLSHDEKNIKSRAENVELLGKAAPLLKDLSIWLLKRLFDGK